MGSRLTWYVWNVIFGGVRIFVTKLLSNLQIYLKHFLLNLNLHYMFLNSFNYFRSQLVLAHRPHRARQLEGGVEPVQAGDRTNFASTPKRANGRQQIVQY